MSISIASSPQTIRDWNDLPESPISSSELSDDSVSKYTSLVRATNCSRTQGGGLRGTCPPPPEEDVSALKKIKKKKNHVLLKEKVGVGAQIEL